LPTNRALPPLPPGITVVNSGTGLTANDFDASLGTKVPGSPGANLLQIDFLASGNASGQFGLWAMTALDQTAWADDAGAAHSFDNVNPNLGAMVRIGDINVTGVPEPTTFTLLGAGGAGLAAWGRRRRGPLSS
jgi:hypothetical protein